MRTFIEGILKSTEKYNIFDFSSMKIGLISFGILIGAYFSDFFLQYTAILWIIFIASYIWIVYITFIKYKK